MAEWRWEMMTGDLLDLDRLSAAISGAEYVYNFAARRIWNEALSKPLETVRVNVLGNANVPEACRQSGVRRFIYASTVCL